MEKHTFSIIIEWKTKLAVEMGIIEEYRDYFFNTWPKALDKIKDLAEKY